MYSVMQFYAIMGVLSYLTHSAYGIQCYACESDNYSNCNENNFDDEGIPKIDCNDVLLPRYLAVLNPDLKPTGCKKLTLESMDGKERTIERFCYFGSLNDTTEGCRPEPTFEGTTVGCEVCSDDLCNSSVKIIPRILTISLIYLIYSFIKNNI